MSERMGDMDNKGRDLEEFVNLLRQKNYHVATAESCTGGYVAGSIVSVAGASDVFEEGYVTYSDRVKAKLLGVDEKTLERFTAVSSQVAEQMAQGVLQKAGAEISISVTGYAGPGAAEDGTPAGTVYIGTCLLGQTRVKKFRFDGDREEVRIQSVDSAIRFALERIREIE